MVIIENIVEINITLEPKAASQPYLSASIAVVVPAGIPVNKTDTPIIRESIFNNFNKTKTSKGNANKRIKVKYNIALSKSWLTLHSDNMHPITIIDTGIVH